MPVDLVAQTEVFLRDYVSAFPDIGAWAQKPPRISMSFDILRALLEADLSIDDLEAILQEMIAERVKPKSWPYLFVVLKSRIEDLRHERKTRSATRS